MTSPSTPHALAPVKNISEFKETIRSLRAEGQELQRRIDHNRQQTADKTFSQFTINPLERFKIKSRAELTGHLSKVYALAWSSDNRHIVSAGQDGQLIIWNALKRYKVNVVSLKSHWMMTCSFSPTGNFVACGGLANICTIYSVHGSTGDDTTPSSGNDSQSMKLIQQLHGHNGYISACKFITDRHILTSSGDSSCILWDIQRGSCVRSFTGHRADVMGVSIAPDQQTFISASCDKSLKLWDMRQAKCGHTFTGHASDVNSVDHFPNGLSFLSGSEDSTCKLFDIRADRHLMTYNDRNSKEGVTSVAFSKSGRVFFAAYDDRRAVVWDTLRGDVLQMLTDHSNRVSALAVSPDGTCLATSSWDCTVRLWA